MKKRTAQKIISRSILVLAVYRKSTMGRALTRRPRFWTVSRRHAAAAVAKRVRVQFAEEPQNRLILPPGEIPERSFG
jgi:hypothetical protein